MMKMESIEKKMNTVLDSWNNTKERDLNKLAQAAKGIVESKESYVVVDYGDYEIHLTYFPDKVDYIWIWHNNENNDLEEVFELPQGAVNELRRCFAANLIKYGFYL